MKRFSQPASTLLRHMSSGIRRAVGSHHRVLPAALEDGFSNKISHPYRVINCDLIWWRMNEIDIFGHTTSEAFNCFYSVVGCSAIAGAVIKLLPFHQYPTLSIRFSMLPLRGEWFFLLLFRVSISGIYYYIWSMRLRQMADATLTWTLELFGLGMYLLGNCFLPKNVADNEAGRHDMMSSYNPRTQYAFVPKIVSSMQFCESQYSRYLAAAFTRGQYPDTRVYQDRGGMHVPFKRQLMQPIYWGGWVLSTRIKPNNILFNNPNIVESVFISALATKGGDFLKELSPDQYFIRNFHGLYSLLAINRELDSDT